MQDELSYTSVLRQLLENPTQGKLAAKALMRGRSTRDKRFEEVPLSPEDIQGTLEDNLNSIPNNLKQNRFRD